MEERSRPQLVGRRQATRRVLHGHRPPRAGRDPRRAHERRRSAAPALLWEEIRGLGAHGCAVLLVTHNVLEAEKSVDRLAVIHKGRLVAEGTPSSMKAADRSQLRLQLMLTPGMATPGPAFVGRSAGACRAQPCHHDCRKRRRHGHRLGGGHDPAGRGRRVRARRHDPGGRVHPAHVAHVGRQTTKVTEVQMASRDRPARYRRARGRALVARVRRHGALASGQPAHVARDAHDRATAGRGRVRARDLPVLRPHPDDGCSVRLDRGTRHQPADGRADPRTTARGRPEGQRQLRVPALNAGQPLGVRGRVVHGLPYRRRSGDGRRLSALPGCATTFPCTFRP